jgi:hypothetical protein
MWAFSSALVALWRSLFGSARGSGMKAIGILILVAGLALGAFALTMNVAVEVPAQDFGYGVRTPSMQVANIDRMAQRQNYIIFSGILSVVGAILFGFGSMARRAEEPVPPADQSPLPVLAINDEPRRAPTSVSICPACRHMGDGDATTCARCETPLAG